MKILYKNIEIIENFSNKQNQLYHSIKQKNTNNICYYFKKLDFNDILKYMKNILIKNRI